MNKEEYTIATEVEKLIAKYEKDTTRSIFHTFRDFKWELRNILTKYS